MADNLNYNSGAVVTYFARLDMAVIGTMIELSNITTPGVDGVAFRQEALRPGEFEAQSSVFVATGGDYDAVRVIYEALKGRLLTINRTSFGLSHANVLVLDVAVAQPIPMARCFYVILPDGSVSTGVGFEVRARWKFIYGGPP